MKICRYCKQEKDLSLFYSDVTKTQGRSNRCIECDKAIKKEKQANSNYQPDPNQTHKVCRICKENKEVSNFYTAKDRLDGYDKDCKECRKAKEKNRYKDNADEVKQRTLDYYYNNKPQRRASVRKRQKERMETDPLFVLKRRLRNRLWYAIKNKGWQKNSKLKDYVGCDYSSLVNHIEFQFKDGMTWENKGLWHIDHIIPLDSAKTEEELLKLCHYTNLQPMWARDNIVKGTKT